MFQKLYTLFIAPRQPDEDTRNREIVLNVLLAGTLLVLLLALPLLLVSYLGLHHTYVAPRIGMIVAVIAGVGLLYRLSRAGRFKIAAYLLVGLYFLLASFSVYRWGINIPSGILLYGLVIVLAGILISPKYSLYAAGSVVALLVALQAAGNHGLVQSKISWVMRVPNMGDVLGFCLIFGVLALVSWLFNYQMERSLHRAERAEAALTKQKSLLESTVERRTRELQAAQLEKVQQMYRFAELGQLSTALLHDLANHLTTLTLDIEGLEQQNRSRVLSRAKRSIRHIDDMVLRVRDQLRGRSHNRLFSIASEVDEMINMMSHKARAAGVTLSWQTPADKKALRCRGEPIRFRQLIANLISNGVDAYDGDVRQFKRREVQITATATKTTVTITVTDWGKGIPASQRTKLFEPFNSTKKTGMGMGLFIVKQIAHEHFLGSVALDATQQHTAFVVTLPRGG